MKVWSGTYEQWGEADGQGHGRMLDAYDVLLVDGYAIAGRRRAEMQMDRELLVWDCRPGTARP